MNRNLFPIAILILLSCNQTESDKQANNKPLENTPTLDVFSFEEYCNQRFGYCIEYPKGILNPEAESENEDGRIFTNKTGNATLTVFGRLNDQSVTLEQQFENEVKGGSSKIKNKDRDITYKRLGKNFFVLSGYNNGNVFYQKTILKNGSLAYAILEYKQEEKAMFDRFSEKVFSSFR